MDNKVIFQRLGIILAYPLAYAYIRLLLPSGNEFLISTSTLTFTVAYPLIALLFIIVNEIAGED